MANVDGQVYDGFTGKFRAPKTDQEKLLVAIADANAAGEKLPIDRTEEDMRRLEPGMAGAPTVTGVADTVDMDRAGAGAGRAAGGRTTP